jgi:hypothetical protein
MSPLRKTSPRPLSCMLLQETTQNKHACLQSWISLKSSSSKRSQGSKSRPILLLLQYNSPTKNEIVNNVKRSRLMRVVGKWGVNRNRRVSTAQAKLACSLHETTHEGNTQHSWCHTFWQLKKHETNVMRCIHVDATQAAKAAHRRTVSPIWKAELNECSSPRPNTL